MPTCPFVGDVKRTLPLLTERIRPRDHSAWIEEFRACDRIEYERVVRRRSVPTEGASAWARRSTPWHAPTTATR